MRRAVYSLLLLAACRFGGEDGDALALVEPPRDAGPDGSRDATVSEMDAGPAPPTEDAEPAEAAVPLDAELVDAASSDAWADAADPRDCDPAALAVCDPVRDTGCTPGVTQCVVDPEAAGLVGRCVFTGLALDPCSESLLTSCPSQHACLGTRCLRFCHCDADCGAGTRCTTPRPGSSDTTIMLCAPAAGPP